MELKDLNKWYDDMKDYLTDEEIYNFAMKFMKNENKSFAVRCLLDSKKETYDRALELVEGAKDESELYELVANDDFIKEHNRQAWCECSKQSDGHWDRCKELMGDDIIETYSDMGSVALCDDNMTFCSYVRNGYGDGETLVKVFEKGECDEALISSMMKFHDIIKGEFNLLNYDCAFENHNKDNMVYHFNGTYAVYYYEGLVIFVKWK